MITGQAHTQAIKAQPRQTKIAVDPVYNPMNESDISSKTKLAKGVTVARFLGGSGDGTTLNGFNTLEKRQQLARNLYVQSLAISSIEDTNSLFPFQKVLVDEGVYKKGPSETPTPDSINDLAQTGRAIAYKIINTEGVAEPSINFDVAEYWKDTLLYEKIILDYDFFNPDGSLDVQIIVTVPKIPTSWTASFPKNIETTLNGKVQSSGELIEILR